MSEMIDAKPNKIGAQYGMVGGALLIGGGALTAMGLSGGFDVDAFAPSFMLGAMFWIMMSMGCMGLMLLFHVTRGRWGTPLLRVFESGASPINLAFCFALVMVAWFVFKIPLYGMWINVEPTDMIILNKQAYLNETAWVIRQPIYFAILIALSWRLMSWTRLEEKTGDKKYNDYRNNLAAPGILIFILVMTFFITDFLMSIDAHWFSTVWGFLFTVGSALSAMSLAVAVVVANKDKAPFAGKVDNLMTKDFGNLLLMLTMLWAYLSFSQMLIIWSGNLKEFIPYYLKRIVGGYSTLGTVLVIMQFFGPFLLLLSPKLKRTSRLLVPTALLIFGVRFVEMFWLVMPYFRKTMSANPADFGMLCLIGGIWFLISSFGMRGAGLVVDAHPYQHAELKEASAHV